ncbi:MAG: hypothetical protein RIR62_1709 [Pseudomonadota bacterium]
MSVSLRVASWNIHKGVGSDRRRDLERTARVIAELGADLVCLQEADRRFGDRAGLLDLDALRSDCGLVAVPVDASGPMSHGWHGNLILVREGIEMRHVRPLSLPGLEPRGALVAELRTAGRPLRVIGAHFGLLPRSRRAQARTILDRIDEMEPHPTLLMGDLNEWRTGPSSPLAPFLRHFRPSHAPRSFPAPLPVLPLDRVMVGPVGELHDIAAHASALARKASDHLPVTARLVLP